MSNKLRIMVQHSLGTIHSDQISASCTCENDNFDVYFTKNLSCSERIGQKELNNSKVSYYEAREKIPLSSRNQNRYHNSDNN